MKMKTCKECGGYEGCRKLFKELNFTVMRDQFNSEDMRKVADDVHKVIAKYCRHYVPCNGNVEIGVRS